VDADGPYKNLIYDGRAALGISGRPTPWHPTQDPL
jgi:hypothetical protein